MTQPNAWNSTLPRPTKWMRRSLLARQSRQQQAKNRHWFASKSKAIQTRGSRCQFAGCAADAVHAHHIQSRGQGGSNKPDNLLLLCGAHHDWIHANPEQSYRRGYLCRRPPVLRDRCENSTEGKPC